MAKLGGKFRSGLAAALLASTAVLVAAPAQAQQVAIDIPAQSAADAITKLGQQTGTQILFDHAQLSQVKSNAVRGSMSVREALAAILRGSKFEVSTSSSGALVVRPTGTVALTAAGNDAASLGDEAVAQGQEGTAEILVVGRRSQNADIRRTENDVQPYVVFSGEDIRRTGVASAEEYLFSRLPQNTQSLNPRLGSAMGGRIDLRGLGTDETLVLIDGRPAPRSQESSAGFYQSSISGIAPEMIERIEVLPATAGGKYGGNATGGVINVVLKRDYSGVSLAIEHSDTMDFAAPATDISANAGISLFGGKTQVIASITHREEKPLSTLDRQKLLSRGRALLLQNDPPARPIAFGLTPNFCALDLATANCIPTDLTLDDGTSLGSNHAYVPIGYRGVVAEGDGGEAFQETAGSFISKVAKRSMGLAIGRTSANLNIRQKLSDAIEVYGDYRMDKTKRHELANGQIFVRLPGTSEFNPFQQNIGMWATSPEFESHKNDRNDSARAGLLAKLPFNWSGSAEYNWNRARNRNNDFLGMRPQPAAVLNYLMSVALIDPAEVIDPLPASAYSHRRRFVDVESQSNGVAFRLSGPVMKLPGGDLTLNSSLERHRDSTDEEIEETVNIVGGEPLPFSLTWQPKISQHVTSAYIEARAPIFSKENNKPFLRELEVIGALRYDKYKYDVVQSRTAIPTRDGPFPTLEHVKPELTATSFMIGGKYSPIQDVGFRASYGTGFLPPNLSQFVAAERIGIAGLFDPARDNELNVDEIHFTETGNPNLEPEKSASFSVGAILTPRFISGLRFSVDYIKIDKSDEILTLSPTVLVNNEEAFPGRVVRGPLTPEDQAAGYTVGRIIALDISPVNVTNSRVRAWDFQVDYNFNVNNLGDFKLYAVGSYQTSRKTKLEFGTPFVEEVGSRDGPLRLRWNGGLDWNLGRWSAGWNAQYFHHYDVCSARQSPVTCDSAELQQGSSKIASQTYHDIYLSYAIPAGESGYLSGLQVSAMIQNVFNKLPPAIATGFGSYEAFSTYGDARLRRFALRVRKSF